MILKSLMISAMCLAFGIAAADDKARAVVQLDSSLTPDVIENGLFPKSSTAADCEEAARAGFTCGQIVPRKVFSLPSNISFSTGSAQLSDSAKALLAGFGPVLKRNENTDRTVILVGHTDITGSRLFNQRLSLRRAEAVRQYFITTFGISPSFLKAVGVGSDQLEDQNNPASAVNRRVEISTKAVTK